MSEVTPPRGLYTEEEVARLQASEAKVVLKGLLRNLEDVHAQRLKSEPSERRGGELWGLGVAISAVKRRLK